MFLGPMMNIQTETDPEGSRGHCFPHLLIPVMIGFEDLNIISSNVRGALHENGRLFVKELTKNKKPDVVLLYETRCLFS